MANSIVPVQYIEAGITVRSGPGPFQRASIRAPFTINDNFW